MLLKNVLGALGFEFIVRALTGNTVQELVMNFRYNTVQASAAEIGTSPCATAAVQYRGVAYGIHNYYNSFRIKCFELK